MTIFQQSSVLVLASYRQPRRYQQTHSFVCQQRAGEDHRNSFLHRYRFRFCRMDIRSLFFSPKAPPEQLCPQDEGHGPGEGIERKKGDATSTVRQYSTSVYIAQTRCAENHCRYTQRQRNEPRFERRKLRSVSVQQFTLELLRPNRYANSQSPKSSQELAVNTAGRGIHGSCS